MNKIILNQNKKSQIDKLAAQRFLYSAAKKFLLARLGISVIFAIIGPLLMFAIEEAKPYVAISAIFYIFIDCFFLKRIEKKHRRDAAKIQELFDVSLFDLKWNSLVVGGKPNHEKIFLYKKNYKKHNKLSVLENWYPLEIEKLCLLPAVAVCQRTNVWWDVGLRKKFFWSLILFIILLTSVIFTILKDDQGNLLLLIFSLLPFYQVLTDFIVSQFSSINRIEKLEGILKDLLGKTVNENTSKLENDLRIIQDEIFRHRETCLSVPDWFYKIFRDNQEAQMNYGAEKYVEDILKRS